MTVDDYLKSHTVAKLHLGCGGNILDGWLNTDIALYHGDAMYMDLTKNFPVPDGAMDYVFSEHTIEHLSYAQGLHMLKESHRVLKPGGKVRISCPDIQFLIDMYTKPEQIHRDYIESELPSWAPYADAIFIINNYVRDWGHQFIYDKTSLTASLLAVGFLDVQVKNISESDDVNLQGLEIPSRMKPGFLKLETMTLEAVKHE